MAGTIIITGANGSLAIPAVQRLLADSAKYTLVLTVRDVSDTDANTNLLRKAISESTNGSATIHELDLSRLEAVIAFAQTIALKISKQALPPLAGIVCNAFCWNLTQPLELTKDGYEKTFQVNHLAHAALILRLQDSFGPDGGRVVLFSSDSHEPGKNSLEKYPPAIPEDLDLLVKPAPDDPVDYMGQGFRRYATSKLAIVMWAYALNRHLEKDVKYANITAVAVNPGNLTDSRALRTNTPASLQFMGRWVLEPLRPVLKRLLDRTMRTSAEAGADIATLASNQAHPGERGYFTLLEKDESSTASKDEKKQEELWAKTHQWVGNIA